LSLSSVYVDLKSSNPKRKVNPAHLKTYMRQVVLLDSATTADGINIPLPSYGCIDITATCPTVLH
jgi:hypothetical protein